VGGKTHLVRVVGGRAEFDVSRDGKTLLRIKITAEVDGIRRDYVITYGRRGADNAVVGLATAKADAPGGREAEAERISALIKALTGKEPWIRRMKNGRIIIVCGREHLDGFMRYIELADDIEKWLEETSR
jgi:riboflavin biosynthesis pyrimidine reductase